MKHKPKTARIIKLPVGLPRRPTPTIKRGRRPKAQVIDLGRWKSLRASGHTPALTRDIVKYESAPIYMNLESTTPEIKAAGLAVGDILRCVRATQLQPGELAGIELKRDDQQRVVRVIAQHTAEFVDFNDNRRLPIEFVAALYHVTGVYRNGQSVKLARGAR
jgi:hypothetical protein